MIPIYYPVKFLSSKFLIITIAIIPYENIRKARARKRSKKSLFFYERSKVIVIVIQQEKIYLYIILKKFTYL